MTEVATTPEVERWLRSTGADGNEPEQRTEMLRDLEAFCLYTTQTPNELVQSCLRTTKTGETTISARGRSQMQEVIESFVTQQGFTGHRAALAANRIRGFLIHNGVFMQGRPLIR